MGNRLEFSKNFSLSSIVEDEKVLESQSIVDFADSVLAEVKKILKAGSGIRLSGNRDTLTLSLEPHTHEAKDINNLYSYVSEVIVPGENISIKTGKGFLEITSLPYAHEHTVAAILDLDVFLDNKLDSKFSSGLSFSETGSSHKPLLSLKDDPMTGLYFGDYGSFGFSSEGTTRLEITHSAVKLSTALDMQKIYFINNLPNPINDHQAATKKYVDDEIKQLRDFIKSMKAIFLGA